MDGLLDWDSIYSEKIRNIYLYNQNEDDYLDEYLVGDQIIIEFDKHILIIDKITDTDEIDVKIQHKKNL